MIILSFKLEKAHFKNWSKEFGYFSFTGISRAEERDTVYSIEKIVKKYFKVLKTHNSKVSENEYQDIRQKLSYLIHNSNRKSAKLNLKNGTSQYHLTWSVEDQFDIDNIKCLMGDSSYATVKKEDFF